MEHWGNITAYPFSLVNRKAHHKAKHGTHLFYLLALILVARKYSHSFFALSFPALSE